MSVQAKQKVAVFFYNMGGPGLSSEVPEFLTELFQDNDLLDLPFPGLLQNFVAEKIVRKRSGAVAQKYDEIGGGSPQLSTTEALCARVEKQVKERLTAFEIVHMGPLMRYSEPRAATGLEKALERGAEEVWLLTQYPHCSRATTGTSLREIALLRRNDPRFAALKLRSFARYGDDPQFHLLWAKRLEQAWNNLQPGKRHLIVSAHNLPLSYIAEGDPYRSQIYETSRQTLRQLGLTEGKHWTLAWQSAVGPVKWMKPDTRDVIRRCAAAGISEVLVWPLAFVSDHIETQHEIDIEFAEIAQEEGLERFERVPNLNCDEDFVNYLSEKICTAAAELRSGSEKGKSETSLSLRDLDTQPSGEGCHLQPGGCLCGRYYLSGKNGLKRGVLRNRVPQSEIPFG